MANRIQMDYEDILC